MLYLDQEDVLRAGGGDIETVLPVVEEVFRLKEAGEVANPMKTEIQWPDTDEPVERAGRVMAMPAYVGGRFDVAGVKWIPSAPGNPERLGLPRANALILLTDRWSGLPLAVMDGTVISAMRTAAVTGLTLRHFGSDGACTGALLGAGAISRAHLSLFKTGFVPIDELRVYDAMVGKATDLAADARTAGLPAEAVRTSSTALAGADFVVAATTASEPFIDPAEIGSGTTVCLLSRLDAPVSLHALTDRVVVDDWSTESGHHGRYVNRLIEAGALRTRSDVTELGAVISGRSPGRTSVEEVVVASTVGLAIEDIAVAKEIFDRACRSGAGQELELREGDPVWV